MPNEADTCRRYVVPRLQAAGWDDEPHRINEQVAFTDGRIVVTGRQGLRRPGKRADYMAEKVRTLYASAADLRDAWADPEDRAVVIAALEERGIDFEGLAEAAGQPDADPFDLLCHIAYNAPCGPGGNARGGCGRSGRTFGTSTARRRSEILDELLEKYAAHGTAQFKMPDVLEVPPTSEHGNVIEIAEKFGGEENLVMAIGQL